MSNIVFIKAHFPVNYKEKLPTVTEKWLPSKNSSGAKVNTNFILIKIDFLKLNSNTESIGLSLFQTQTLQFSVLVSSYSSVLNLPQEGYRLP
jgi:hypothetical protein